MLARTWKLARAALPALFTTIYRTTGLGYWPAAWSASRWLTRPTRFRPRSTPCQHGLSWRRLECRTADDVRLVGWEVAPPEPQGTIALFHGLRKNREHTFGRCRMLVEAGYRCVAFDHRAHGESGGSLSSFGYHERHDVAAVLQLVQQRWPEQPRAVLGLSMGAAALCFAHEHTRQCQAIILESCYSDVFTAFGNRLKSYPDWMRKLSAGTIKVTERRLALDGQDVNPALYIDKLNPAPVLLLTGTKDKFASPEEAQLLHDKCSGPRELFLVPDADHGDVFEVGAGIYKDKVLDFLQRHMAAALAGEFRAA